MGLLRFEGVTQRSVVIEQAEGVLNLLPTVPLGGPATVATRGTRSMRSFTLPWIPHDNVVTPQDIQGVRGFGVADAADQLATVMERKLTRMRVNHTQTREYMEAFGAWLAEARARVSARSRIGEKLAYFANHWCRRDGVPLDAGLLRPREDGVRGELCPVVADNHAGAVGLVNRDGNPCHRPLTFDVDP